MPRTTSKERKETSARVIHGYFRDAADAKVDREQVHRDAYRRTDPSYVPESVGHPRVKSPYIFSVLNTKLSWLVRAIKANGHWALAHPHAFEYQDDGPVVTELINQQFRHPRLKNETSIVSGFGQGFKYGDHYWLLSWYEDAVGNWGVRFNGLNINDVYPDPWAQRYYILRRFITLQEFAREVAVLSRPIMTTDPETGEEVQEVDGKGRPVFSDGGVARRAYDRIEKAIKEGHLPERYGWHWTQHKNTFPAEFGRYSGADDKTAPSNSRGEDDPANVRLTIIEYHETGDDGIVAKVIPDNPNSTESEDLFLQEATPHPYGRCQVIRWAPWPVDDEAFGYSLSEIVGGLADVHDYALRATIRRVQRYADPAVLHRRRAKIKPVYLRSQSNIAIPVENKDDITYMDPPTGGDMHHSVHLLTKGSMDMGTGESEQRRGQIGGASSATEAAIAEQAGSTSDFLVASRAFQVIEDMADLAMRILRVHVTEDQLIPVLGARTAQYMTLNTDALERQYHFTFGGSPLGGNPSLRVTNLMNVFTQTAQTGVWDPTAVVEFALKEAGYNADQFLNVKKGPPPVPAEFEHKQLEAAQDIEVSPQDDHEDHFRKHQVQMFLAQQGFVEMSEENLVKLARHVAEHAAILQQQQLAAQAQQGGPAGPQPFQPGQAGQPGQPATFGPRTADINQQRQSPNNGQSPQPATAPGRVGVVNGQQVGR